MHIDVKRTCIEIYPYNEDNRVENLERSLSVYSKEYFRYDPIGLYWDEEKEKLIIPRSMSIRQLEKTFDCPANVIREYDPISKVPIKLKYEPRDDIQRESIEFLLGKGKHEGLERYSRLMLELDTGMGKTFCSMAYVSYKQVKAAVIVNTSNLMEQWKERITEYTNLHEKEIFILAGSKSIDKVLNGDSDKYKIFIVSHKTIQSYAKKNGWDSIRELFKAMKIGVKIFDEAHLEMVNTLRIDMFSNTYKTIYITATANRSGYSEDHLYKQIYGQVPILQFHRSKEDAYMRSIIMEYDSSPSLSTQALLVNRHGLDGNKYIEYQFYGKGKQHFIKCINVIMNTVLPRDGKIAILLGKRNVARDTRKYLMEHYPELKDDVGLFTSDISDRQKKMKELEKRVICTTSKSFGTGTDLNNLRVIVMCEPYSSKVTLKQVTGRLRDIGGEVYYFELVDTGVPQRFRQFNSVKKELLKRSEKVTSFNIQL